MYININDNGKVTIYKNTSRYVVDAVDVHVGQRLFPVIFAGQSVLPGQVAGNGMRLSQHFTVNFQERQLAE